MQLVTTPEDLAGCQRSVSAIADDLQRLAADLTGLLGRGEVVVTVALEDAVRALYEAGVAVHEAQAASAVQPLGEWAKADRT
jgi:hypothetical protein